METSSATKRFFFRALRAAEGYDEKLDRLVTFLAPKGGEAKTNLELWAELATDLKDKEAWRVLDSEFGKLTSPVMVEHLNPRVGYAGPQLTSDLLAGHMEAPNLIVQKGLKEIPEFVREAEVRRAKWYAYLTDDMEASNNITKASLKGPTPHALDVARFHTPFGGKIWNVPSQPARFLGMLRRNKDFLDDTLLDPENFEAALGKFKTPLALAMAAGAGGVLLNGDPAEAAPINVAKLRGMLKPGYFTSDLVDQLEQAGDTGGIIGLNYVEKAIGQGMLMPAQDVVDEMARLQTVLQSPGKPVVISFIHPPQEGLRGPSQLIQWEVWHPKMQDYPVVKGTGNLTNNTGGLYVHKVEGVGPGMLGVGFTKRALVEMAKQVPGVKEVRFSTRVTGVVEKSGRNRVVKGVMKVAGGAAAAGTLAGDPTAQALESEFFSVPYDTSGIVENAPIDIDEESGLPTLPTLQANPKYQALPPEAQFEVRKMNFEEFWAHTPEFVHLMQTNPIKAARARADFIGLPQPGIAEAVASSLIRGAVTAVGGETPERRAVEQGLFPESERGWMDTIGQVVGGIGAMSLPMGGGGAIYKSTVEQISKISPMMKGLFPKLAESGAGVVAGGLGMSLVMANHQRVNQQEILQRTAQMAGRLDKGKVPFMEPILTGDNEEHKKDLFGTMDVGPAAAIGFGLGAGMDIAFRSALRTVGAFSGVAKKLWSKYTTYEGGKAVVAGEIPPSAVQYDLENALRPSRGMLDSSSDLVQQRLIREPVILPKDSGPLEITLADGRRVTPEELAERRYVGWEPGDPQGLATGFEFDPPSPKPIKAGAYRAIKKYGIIEETGQHGLTEVRVDIPGEHWWQRKVAQKIQERKVQGKGPGTGETLYELRDVPERKYNWADVATISGTIEDINHLFELVGLTSKEFGFAMKMRNIPDQFLAHGVEVRRIGDKIAIIHPKK